LLLSLLALCAIALCGMTEIRIPPARAGAVRVQAEGSVAGTGTGTSTYVNGSFSDVGIFSANWITGGLNNGPTNAVSASTTAGFLTVKCNAGVYINPPRGLLSTAQSGDFDVTVKADFGQQDRGLLNGGHCLLYYVSDDTFIEIYRVYADAATDYIGAYAMNSGSWVLNSQDQLPSLSQTVWLRISRIGNVFSTRYKQSEGAAWSVWNASSTIALPTTGRVG